MIVGMDEWNWRSPLLGELHTLEVPGGVLEYWERGVGPTLVFSHGWLSNANLWRKVVDDLSKDHRCVVLDLPLGAHRRAMNPGADLTPAGVAGLVAATVVGLDLRGVSLIGNDSGGAYSQIAVSQRPERVARLVLNSCETPYDEFPPPPFDGLPAAAESTETLAMLLGALRDPAVRLTPPAYGLLIKHPVDEQAYDAYALPSLEDPEILRDTAKVMSSARSAPVHEAGARLIESFERPVLLAWSPEDQVFDPSNARRYADALPNARLELVDDAYSFTPEDQPAALARAIAAFAAP